MGRIVLGAIFSPRCNALHARERQRLLKGAPLGERVTGSQVADEVARAVKLRLTRSAEGELWLRVSLLPVSVDRGKEVRIGDVAAARELEQTSYAMFVPVAEEQAKRTEKLAIVLAGDGEALRNTLDQQKYWAGRIVYPDVPVGRSDDVGAARASPTTRRYRVD